MCQLSPVLFPLLPSLTIFQSMKLVINFINWVSPQPWFLQFSKIATDNLVRTKELQVLDGGLGRFSAYPGADEKGCFCLFVCLALG